jgi:hypothetical protein
MRFWFCLLCCPVNDPHTVGGKAFAEDEKGLETVTASSAVPQVPVEAIDMMI